MCCGAIDGKHIVMQCPGCAGSSFFNYKGVKNNRLQGCKFECATIFCPIVKTTCTYELFYLVL